ncbi:ATP-grasp domain-containing protein [Campylobacter troglodytis]|uniref:ATP-grasp domain-containing protein n=1 Tax=Campylobacter troglodytis TaxID=654363 RepID=UPI00115A1867|nr:hypothetical protein [Campylobacter troglodytis]
MPNKSKSKEFIILSCKDFPQGNASLQALCVGMREFFAKKGFECEAKILPWQELKLSNLSENSVLLPLAVWDYSAHYDEFVSFLDELEALNLSIFNPLKLLRWNVSKLYLKELDNLGFDIIPSIFVEKNLDKEFVDDALQSAKKWQNPIIKPLVGQSGKGVMRLEGLNSQEITQNKVFKKGFIIQQFIPEICEDGELCLVFFNACFQYAILRQVAQGEFRANSNFGVHIQKCEFVDKKCLDIAKRIFSHLPQTPLYARFDFITHQGRALLNELELIEPNLYFDYEEKAINHFCAKTDFYVWLKTT